MAAASCFTASSLTIVLLFVALAFIQHFPMLRLPLHFGHLTEAGLQASSTSLIVEKNFVIEGNI